jgi:hypothetical protein
MASGQGIMLAVMATQAPLTALAVLGTAGLTDGAGEAAAPADAAGLPDATAAAGEPEAAGLALALGFGLALEGALEAAGELGAAAWPQPASERAVQARVVAMKARREMGMPDGTKQAFQPARA